MNHVPSPSLGMGTPFERVYVSSRIIVISCRTCGCCQLVGYSSSVRWSPHTVCGCVPSVVLGGIRPVRPEDLFGDTHRGHRLGPTGVERKMGDRFDQLGLGGAVVPGEVEVEAQLVGVAER